ncbi:hypothetical protein JOE44_001905 [Chryseobacterium sp. PvR013]|uniref:hypothetical protein n=1 Tax=Chryseobacterium sp. PvR013 TaxID=2806595 RepID=UPI001AE4667A|nr:hypothetical protein [Chryseobacterium sp. PvR013]MBP1165021.1 hypothetical protein [Chryseobacterium sp. PvR013]
MKLIPLSDFVLEQEKKLENILTERLPIIKTTSALSKIIDYAKFLKQPLKLGMFLPMDKHGVVLEPLQFCCTGSDCGCMGMPVNVSSQEEIDEYYQAEDKVLFNGFRSKPAINEVFNDSLKLTIYLEMFQFMNVHENGLGGGDLIGSTIEALAHADLGIELTPSALEAIGIKE